MSGSTILLPFQPTTMSTAQLAAVSYLARYSGHTHRLYASQLRRWFAWCESNGLDPLAELRMVTTGVLAWTRKDEVRLTRGRRSP
jgi:integrase/recombinase XerD